ncbi:MAG: carboxypeptidase-like regulatory domain-containing protein [bacterium]
MGRKGLIFLLLFFICSCKAERFNPVDPKSPYFRDQGAIVGTVYDWNAGYVEGARIELKPGLAFAISDASGQYQMSRTPTGSHAAVATRYWFCPETLQIEVFPASTAVVNFRLDHLPIFSDIRAATHNDNNIAGNDLYAVFFARVYDTDGWVWSDSVYCNIDSSLIWPMKDLGGDSFSLTLPEESLPDSSLEYLIGKRFTLLAIDNAGRSSVSDSFAVYRIIYEVPIALSPILYAPQNPVTFKWFRIDTLIEHTYTLTVEQIDSPDSVWVVEGIPSSSGEYFLPNRLPSGGSFRWCIKAVDTFGNSSRSRFEFFRVD